MKAYRESRGTVPLNWNLSLRQSWVLRFTPKPLHPWREFLVPSPQETGWAGPQSQSGGAEEQIPCPARIWTPIVQLMVQLLHKMSHPIYNFLQQCGCNDISVGKFSTWFLSADKVNGGKHVLTHHGYLHVAHPCTPCPIFHSWPQPIHPWYTQIQFSITPTSFGIIYAILRELQTRI